MTKPHDIIPEVYWTLNYNCYSGLPGARIYATFEWLEIWWDLTWGSTVRWPLGFETPLPARDPWKTQQCNSTTGSVQLLFNYWNLFHYWKYWASDISGLIYLGSWLWFHRTFNNWMKCVNTYSFSYWRYSASEISGPRQYSPGPHTHTYTYIYVYTMSIITISIKRRTRDWGTIYIYIYFYIYTYTYRCSI